MATAEANAASVFADARRMHESALERLWLGRKDDED